MTDAFDREELDRLYAAATPGEWGSRTITAWGGPTEFAHLVGPLRPRSPWGTAEWRTVDTEAIVALHNAYPAISRALERAERLERLAEAARRYADDPGDHKAEEALLAALAALEATP